MTHAVVVMAVLVGLAGCWRQPGFNSLRQGWNPYEGQLTAANVHTLDEAWTAEVDDGPVRSDPVISGADLVHVSDDQAVYGLTPSGERLWRTDVVPGQPAGMRAGPVSAGETTLQVPWGGVPDNGGTDVLDTATGTLVDHDFSIGVRSLTLRDPWRVSGYSGFGEGTIAGAGFRVDGPHSFAVLFGFEVGPELPPPTAAAISTDDRLFVGIESSESFGSDRLAGWDLESECELWTPPEQCQPDVSTQLDGVPTEPVVAEGGTVYVATDAGTVYAVDAATGTVQWTADVGAPVTQRPALTTRGLFVVTDAGELVVLNASRCEVPVCEPAWSTSLAGSPVAAPAVAGGVVYVASTGGTIEAIPESGSGGGEPLWDTNLSAEITGGPTVGNGLLLAGTADGHVVAFAPGG